MECELRAIKRIESKEPKGPTVVNIKGKSREASSILLKAANLVSKDRSAQHGDKYQNHQNIADLWSAFLGTKITAQQAALMMALLKIARTKTGSYNPDDYDDMAGYSGVAGEIAASDSWARD